MEGAGISPPLLLLKNQEKRGCPGSSLSLASIMLPVKSSFLVWCLAAGALIVAGCTSTQAASTGDAKTPEAILASGGVPEGNAGSSKEPSTGVESNVTIGKDGVREINITPKSDEKPIDPEKVVKGDSPAAAPAASPAPPASNKPKDGEEVAVFETEKGRIIARFRPDKAPKHVANFKDLVSKKFYDGTRFHRCIAGFMIQGGDPNSKDLAKSDMWGTGGYMVNGSERQVDLEPSDLLHKRGVLSMARSQNPNSASSQFFLMHQDAPSLDGEYSAFGEIVSGIEVVDKIVVTGNPADNGSVEPKAAIVLKSVRLAKWPVK